MRKNVMEEEEGEKMILTLLPPPFPLTFQWENSREMDLPYFEVDMFAKKTYPVIFFLYDQVILIHHWQKLDFFL